MAIDEQEHVRVVRKADGLWLHFGEYAAVRLASFVEELPPITAEQVTLFCERVSEPPA